MSTSVSLKNVTKRYKMYKKTSDKLLDLALPSGYGKNFYALQNISFQAEQGDIIGIIGVNGAGKSTISNIISGIIPPSSGTIDIKGDAALISIGAGLNNQLSGRENIELKCLMLGFKKQEIQDLMPEIIDFAEIGEFIDQPVKKYSSGMKSRLGFAISVNIDPDILIIDEALSVGDKIFAQKCLDKMNSFKEKGKTIFFISHSIGQVKEFCQKALWLEAGEVRAYGPVEEVIPQYEKFIKEFNKMSKEEKKQFNLKVMEKRSRRQASEAELAMDPTNGVLSRRKPKGKRGAVLKSLLVVVFLLASTLIYFKWHNLITYFQADKKVHVSNGEDGKTADDKTQEKNPEMNANQPAEDTTAVVEKDLRYVNLSTGFVRDIPDLATSKKVTMVDFGDPIMVEQTEKDPVEDFSWLQFTLANGLKGWISERLVTKLETPLNEESMVSAVGTIVNDEQLAKTLSVLGKTKEELGTAANNKSIQLAYNQSGQVKEVSMNIEGITKEQIIDQLGEPILHQGEKAYLYHGERYDFIFYTGNGSSFYKMKVRSVS
ncbi:teichoic acids export ABC transporter ATP-binding subunit TagH [Neobacillus vireti]|uniref:Teichoic acids export protein ATP-binding subunit n=1 Tax=Neobacillus vireti LMG 21834 TaxID=1131730 RepID=A0AB94IQ07_9BACI|nr:teichoic acids export ABC transporter ATP-binding subunit TagH [Neobacillus vireti]ETI69171.1 teichoic acids export protein ATP-binding subunit [Neobacillus vireti LMG 21834]KLT15548.1 hypothetical protein AA980_23175 [Neobacillus vireti]